MGLEPKMHCNPPNSYYITTSITKCLLIDYFETIKMINIDQDSNLHVLGFAYLILISNSLGNIAIP